MLTHGTEVIGPFHGHLTEQALGLTDPLPLIRGHLPTRTTKLGDRIAHDLQLTQTGQQALANPLQRMHHFLFQPCQHLLCLPARRTEPVRNPFDLFGNTVAGVLQVGGSRRIRR